MLAVFVLLSATEAFSRVVEVPGTTVSVRSRGQVGGGTQHGADEVLITSKDGSHVQRVVFSGEAASLPIFTRAYLISEKPKLAVVLGWSSGGSGTEDISAWVIRLDAGQLGVLDTCRVSKPRSFPDVAVNQKTGALAVRLPLREVAYCSREPDERQFVVATLRGGSVDVCRTRPPERKDFAAWEPYTDHPFATAKDSAGAVRTLIEVQHLEFVY